MHQGGKTNGLMAPSRRAQEAVVRDACRRGGIAPGALQYVEAHSGASPIGDATELNALGSVLQAGRAAGTKCAVGSVKTNIGHLEAAAGIAGLMKVALMLRHRTLVPSLHFKSPNVHVPYDTLPLHVQQKREPWPDETGEALAGVSGSGFGGVSAHAVLQGPPAHDVPASPAAAQPQVLALSARTPEALKQLASRYAARLAEDPAINLADLCFTAGTGRTHFSHRLAVVGDSAAELGARLKAYISDERVAGLHTGSVKRGAKESSAQASMPVEQYAAGYVKGESVDWAGLRVGGRRVSGLPAYPFQRQRHWIQQPHAFVFPAANAAVDSVERAPAPATSSAAPGNETEKSLLQMWREILGSKNVGLHDNFFELGGGSIMAIELFTRVEKVLGLRPSPEILFANPTVAELASALRPKDRPAESESLLSMIRAGDGRTPLFLLTPGHLFQFTALSRRLMAGHALYVGAFPERFSTPGITIGEIADAYRAEIERKCPEGAYHLFGFCAGGIVAYEVAQQLKAKGRPPASLGMVDAPCPPPFLASRFGRVGYFASRVGAHVHTIRQLPLRHALGHIVSRGKFLPMVLRLPGFRSARPEQLVTVAHREAVQRYRPAAYDGAVDLYLAEEPWPSAEEDSRLLWRDLARNGNTHRFSGVHDELLKSPRVFEVADRLNEALAGTRVAASPFGERLERAPRPVALSMAAGTRP